MRTNLERPPYDGDEVLPMDAFNQDISKYLKRLQARVVGVLVDSLHEVVSLEQHLLGGRRNIPVVVREQASKNLWGNNTPVCDKECNHRIVAIAHSNLDR